MAEQGKKQFGISSETGSFSSNRLEIYKNILDNAKDIILILTEEGRIIDANMGGPVVRVYL